VFDDLDLVYLPQLILDIAEVQGLGVGDDGKRLAAREPRPKEACWFLAQLVWDDDRVVAVRAAYGFCAIWQLQRRVA